MIPERVIAQQVSSAPNAEFENIFKSSFQTDLLKWSGLRSSLYPFSNHVRDNIALPSEYDERMYCQPSAMKVK